MIEEYERCEKVVQDGAHLTVAQVAQIGQPRNANVKVELDSARCKAGVDNSRAWVEATVERADDIYSITTGFGACCDKENPSSRESAGKNVFLSFNVHFISINHLMPAQPCIHSSARRSSFGS